MPEYAFTNQPEVPAARRTNEDTNKCMSLQTFSCPMEVLEQREAARGDRKIGLARYQSTRVHVHSEYDVEVNIQELSADQAAQKIISTLDVIAHQPHSSVSGQNAW